MSTGGFMAYELACELSDRIVAFGSVAGNFMMNVGQECTSDREIPIMHIHGTSDPIVNYYSPTIDSSMTATEAMEWWSIENNLTEQSVEELNDGLNVFTNSSLTSNAKFVHYQGQDGGHRWFKYDWGFYASEELLNFFMQYSMTDFYLSLDKSSFMSKLFTLSQNYPNPFNPITNIGYYLNKDSFVTVTIYDMLGNVVNNPVNTKQSSGYKSVQWNATDNLGQPVSAGVYLYSIETNDFRQTKKMIFLK